MLKQIGLFILEKDEPIASLFFKLREHILHYDKNISEAWKFNMPFFLYKGNKVCYFRLDQKSGKYYLGFTDGKWIEHPQLTFEKRSRIKIFMLDPAVDLPVETIDSILQLAIGLYG